jgi:hypothetical protein
VLTIREPASDALLRGGTAISIDRYETMRSLEGVPSTMRGYDEAMGAMRLAGWVDSAILWLSWRLRPRTLSRNW